MCQLCFCLSASGCKWLPVTSACKRNCTISSGLPSHHACRVLDFTPQSEIINLITSLEWLLKEYPTKGSVFIQVFLSYNVGRKRGQNEKEQTRCLASCKICQWSQKKWAEGAQLPLTFLLRILMSVLASAWQFCQRWSLDSSEHSSMKRSFHLSNVPACQ